MACDIDMTHGELWAKCESFGREHAFHFLSEMGFVSRVTPVHTALRNCTRDEGRSFEVGNQVLISNHRKLLCPKGMVVNVAELLGSRVGSRRVRHFR
jgi:hypothetical protein